MSEQNDIQFIKNLRGKLVNAHGQAIKLTPAALTHLNKLANIIDPSILQEDDDAEFLLEPHDLQKRMDTAKKINPVLNRAFFGIAA